jgi:hypothetical protein
MGFFTQREHAELNQRRDRTEGNTSPRRVAAHHDAPQFESRGNYAPRWSASEKNRADGDAGRLLEQMTADAIEQIDRLLVELQARRKRLLSEAARVQRDLVDYATLSQSTMQSTKIIAESLTHWNRIRNAPRMGESDEQDRTSAGAFELCEDSGFTAAQPETPAGTDSASGETPEASNSPECPDHTGAETNGAT